MPKSDKTVVVFHMAGCSACDDYMPKFKRVAVKYRNHVPIKHVHYTGRNAATEAMLDKYKIEGFPTTVILDAKEKAILKVEGSLPVAEITKIFEQAAR
jgi:thiol-disulfide isomerase/thioredoxin